MKNHPDTPFRTRHVAFRTPSTLRSRATEDGHSALRTGRAFTLIELLVVISIIAILAALLLPAIGHAKVEAQKKKAQLEAGQIAAAIHAYESDYSKFPVSSNAMNAASAAAGGPEDFTYGTVGVCCAGSHGLNPINGGFSTPHIANQPITTPTLGTPGAYQANNSEVMAVLLDVEYWPAAPSVPTINLGHAKNPQKTHYLNATMAGNTNAAGVGPDGVYRDPWLNPYIITIDLNYDDKARDAFYRQQLVSVGGLNGLILKTDSNGNPVLVNAAQVYEANTPVMVWSAGPDKMIDPTVAANTGANKDNILSWKPQ